MDKAAKITIAILLLAALVEGWLISNLWNTENQIIPASSLMYADLKNSPFGDTLVTMKGSWFSETKLAYPTQSSSIECWKDKGVCFEATGQMSGNYLITASSTYTIYSWTDDEIIASTKALCAETTLTIDRIKEKASLLRKTTGSSSECPLISQEPMLLYLVDGYDAWSKNKAKN